MIAVEQERRDVIISFADGSSVTVAISSLLPARYWQGDWNLQRHDEHEIVLVGEEEESIEISWLTIRSLTDQEFNSHLVERAEEEARQVGLRLRELRESRGISGKELAEKIAIQPQALSRIENGRHALSFPTLSKILTALGYSLTDLARPTRPITSTDALLDRLNRVGISKKFAMKRFVPEEFLGERLQSADAINSIAEVVSRVYNWSVRSVLGDANLVLDTAVIGQVRFKRYGRNKEIQATAYALYAHWLALHVMQAAPKVGGRTLPEDPRLIRSEILTQYGELTFATLLHYSWECGIIVIPLSDPGSFHGACWMIKNRVAIVLKQRTESQARWFYDLAHELGHTVKHISKAHPTLIEANEISPFPKEDESEEIEASEFAGELVLGGRAEELAQRCVRKAAGNIEYLKVAVQEVACEENVPVDSLANYIAFRLSVQQENWWGTADGFQIKSPSPLEIARKELKKRVEWNRINPRDREITLRSLVDA